MTTESLINEAEKYLGRGSLDSAERAFFSALQNTRDESLQAQALSGLATVYREKQQYEKMVQCALDSLLSNEKFWGPQSLQAADSTALAADAFYCSNQPLRAQPLFFHALEVRLMHYPPEHEQILSLQAALLLIALEQGRIEKTIELHQLLLPLYRHVERGNTWINFIGLSSLVERYRQRKAQADAELLLKSEMSLLHQHFGSYKDEFVSVLNSYKALVSESGRSLAEWQLGVVHDQRAPELALASAPPNDSAFGDLFAFLNGEAHASFVARQSFPKFLDAVAMLVESGVSINAAIVQSVKTVSSCPVLGKEFEKAVQDWTASNKPLSQSFVEIGQRLDVSEITQFGAMLAVIKKTGGDFGPMLREQSFATRYHLEAKRIEIESLANRHVSANTYPLKRMQAEEDRRKRRAKGEY